MTEYVLVSSAVVVYLTADQASRAGQAVKEGDDYLEFDNRLIRVNTINAIIPIGEYIDGRRANRQNYLCRHGSVHTFDSWCRCGLEPVESWAKRLVATSDSD